MNRPSFHFDIDYYVNRIVPRSRLHLLPKSISWFLGYREEPQQQVGNVLVWVWAFLGAFVGILVVEAVFQSDLLAAHGTPVIIASFGAAAILEYHTIDSPLAQPRNAILGQVFAASIGVSVTKLFQLSSNFENLRWIAGALAVGLSSAFMGFTKTVHPPAGATALMAATSPEITSLSWFLIPTILLGSTLIIAVACILNNIQRQFPVYWWTPLPLTPSLPDLEGLKDFNGAGKTDGHFENHPKPWISVTKEAIAVPEWMLLTGDERRVLEVLRGRLVLGGVGGSVSSGSGSEKEEKGEGA